ncbi:hypothetical protein [Kurlavirus BKC-1]|nr:hypothetical protein [Kurlavirus BKC-1]QZX43957.1 hypothetical protein MarQu_375 [Marseillevirus sp.]
MSELLDKHFPIQNLKGVHWTDVSWKDVNVLRKECEILETLDLSGLAYFHPLSFLDIEFVVTDFALWKCKIYGRWFWISDRKEKHQAKQQREEWLNKERWECE